MTLDTLILVVALIVFAFGLCWFLGPVTQRVITCRCGRHGMNGSVVIVDEVDARRFAESLSELCPICRTRRQNPHPHPEPRPTAKVATQ